MFGHPLQSQPACIRLVVVLAASATSDGVQWHSQTMEPGRQPWLERSVPPGVDQDCSPTCRTANCYSNRAWQTRFLALPSQPFHDSRADGYGGALVYGLYDFGDVPIQ